MVFLSSAAALNSNFVVSPSVTITFVRLAAALKFVIVNSLAVVAGWKVTAKSAISV